MQVSFDSTTTEVALTPKPYIPSFESVLARSEYTMRLPTYRSSYGRRFHPYPRYAPPRTTVDELMTTVDHRYDDSSSISTLNLDDEGTPATDTPVAANDEKEEVVEASAQAKAPGQFQANDQTDFVRFAFFVVDVALYIRRALNSFRIVRKAPSKLAKD